MNKRLLLATLGFIVACDSTQTAERTDDRARSADSLLITRMIAVREQAMIGKDLPAALAQFADDVTWINSQGYYFVGKREVAKFHGMLAGNDSLDYHYEAGIPLVRIVDSRTAIAYYSWKMFWYRRVQPADTTFREIGLMTLLARKDETGWKWIAVTNQHTPSFYERIEPVRID